MINWPVELLELHVLHQEEERFSGGIVKASPFGTRADLSAIEGAQNAIHSKLDSKHTEFLRHADGWSSFSGEIDLFGTTDFLGSPRFKQAQEWIKLMDRGALGTYAKQRSKLFPIGKSVGGPDLLLMINEGGQLQPKVLWFANELVEEFVSFDEMFVSFKAYARKAIDYWIKRSQRSTP